MNNNTKNIITCSFLALLLGSSIVTQNLFDSKVSARQADTKLSAMPDKTRIVIDPGHGGMDGGCVSVNGVPEKGINLNIAMTERDILNVLGFEPILTREEDKSIYDEGVTGTGKQKQSDMKNRLAMFNDNDTDIAISIHQNQFTDSRYSGAQMFYSRRNSAGEALASAMQRQFVSLLQPNNERETKPVDDELYLLDKTDKPAVMIECGFLSNPEEAAKLEDTSYQQLIAFTVATGLIEYTKPAE